VLAQALSIVGAIAAARPMPKNRRRPRDNPNPRNIVLGSFDVFLNRLQFRNFGRIDDPSKIP
jgi:hypothetical protein